MIAEKLGKYAHEVLEEMPLWEYRGWLAFDKALEAEQDKTKSRARVKAAMKR